MNKRFSYLLLPLFVLTACIGKEPAPDVIGSADGSFPETLSDGEIVLGKRLDNPYSTENMRKAYSSLCPTRSSRDVVETTHLYVRFLPSGAGDIDLLSGMGLVLYDHPLDYEIVKEGDYYHDPSLPEDAITWQYTLVPKDFEFPDIPYEVIEECCMDDPSLETRASGTVSWEALEAEAFRVSGNEDMLGAETRASKQVPQGRFTFSDELRPGGEKIGVAGVEVVCNVFVKIAKGYTDKDGYYKMNKSFSSSKVRYSIVYRNEKSFAIGFDFILVPASVAGLGRHSSAGYDAHFTMTRDPKTWRRSVINNAVYEYIDYCDSHECGVIPPPAGYRIWVFDSFADGYSLMMHQGAIWEGSFISKVFPKAVPILKRFSPDAVIGMKGISSASDLYTLCWHEAAHASHFAQVGKAYWNNFAASMAANAIKGAGRYGNGSLDLDGYTGVCEMWAYYFSSKVYEKTYGRKEIFGKDNWFKPGFLHALGDLGLSETSIWNVLTDDVVSVPSLGKKLVDRYEKYWPGIEDAYNSYFGGGNSSDSGDDDKAVGPDEGRSDGPDQPHTGDGPGGDPEDDRIL